MAEGRAFANQPVPVVSRSTPWEHVGHYSQIVWRGTTTLGCALASNATNDYLVCRFRPVGNVIGERAS